MSIGVERFGTTRPCHPKGSGRGQGGRSGTAHHRNVRLPSFLIVLALFGLLAGDPAQAALGWHGFVVVNQGNEPIFEMHIAKPVRFGQETWGPDLLSFTRVIDVDEGREFKMKLDSRNCVYDVRAIYPDGHEIVLRNVNLCRTDRVWFNY